MAEFKSCDKCKHGWKTEEDYPCNTCKHGVNIDDFFTPKTNVDAIRSMEDEELAEFIEGLSNHCLAGIGEVNCSEQITCENCKTTALTWLQKEVE